MSFKVESISVFDKQAKRLAKKYASLKMDLGSLILSLTTSPAQGVPLGNGFYKIRMSITSKSKGKSGGARIITFVKVQKNSVFLLAIYDKSEQANISEKELNSLFRHLPVD